MYYNEIKTNVCECMCVHNVKFANYNVSSNYFSH